MHEHLTRTTGFQFLGGMDDVGLLAQQKMSQPVVQLGSEVGKSCDCCQPAGLGYSHLLGRHVPLMSRCLGLTILAAVGSKATTAAFQAFSKMV